MVPRQQQICEKCLHDMLGIAHADPGWSLSAEAQQPCSAVQPEILGNFCAGMNAEELLGLTSLRCGLYQISQLLKCIWLQGWLRLSTSL